MTVNPACLRIIKWLLYFYKKQQFYHEGNEETEEKNFMVIFRFFCAFARELVFSIYFS